MRAPQKVTTWVRDFATRVPRLLPRLPRAHRRRRAHPGPAVADRSVPGRPRQRPCAARRARAGRDGAHRRRSRTRSVTAPFDVSLLPRSASVDAAGRVALAGVALGRARRDVRHTVVRLRRDGAAPAVPRVLRRFRSRCCVREQGVPLHRNGAARRRRGSRTRCRDRGRAACRGARRIPDGTRRVPRQQQVGRRARARGAAPRRQSCRRLVRRARPHRADRGERWSVPCPPSARHAGCRSTHARVHRNGHRGLEVRVRARQRQRARGGESRGRQSGPRVRRDPLPHRVAGVPSRFVRTRTRQDGRPRAADRSDDAGDGRGGQHRRRTRRPLSLGRRATDDRAVLRARSGRVRQGARGRPVSARGPC